MKKVLCVIARMDTGGAETMLMKMYRSVDIEKYQFDFVTYVDGKGFYDNEIVERGGKIYPIAPLKQKTLKCFYQFYKIIKENKYEHILLSVPFAVYALMLMVAKLAGVKHIGIRCTNTKVGDGRWLYTTLHKMFKPLANCVANVKLAPSKIAAEWMFGKGCIEDGRAKILKNGLPLKRFMFSNEIRNKIRHEYCIENKIVFGHIGRFVYQKNHRFLIDVFNEIHKINDSTVLILLGTGMYWDEIKEYVNELGLSSVVMMLGIKQDIPAYLMAMDELIFPSFYEGMPNVVIESQCTGLPCVIADTITSEVKATEVVEFKSLQSNAKEWAIAALKKYNECKNNNRSDYNHIMKESGYDIKDVTENFIKYMNL